MLEANHIARHRHDVATTTTTLFEAHGDEVWALVWLMRLALTYRQDNRALGDAADRVMASGPSQPIRVECGRAFARAGNFPRAHEILLGVARDPGAPAGTRANPSDFLVRIAGVEENNSTPAPQTVD